MTVVMSSGESKTNSRKTRLAAKNVGAGLLVAAPTSELMV